jgi:hypothetical protein
MLGKIPGKFENCSLLGNVTNAVFFFPFMPKKIEHHANSWCLNTNAHLK